MLRTYRYLLPAAFLAGLALCGCSPSSAPSPDSMTTAKRVAPAPRVVISAVQLGSAVAPDRTISRATKMFGTGDTVHVAVLTDTGDPATTERGSLSSRWVHAGQVIYEETKEQDFTGHEVTGFQVARAEGWPVGRYEIQILLDGAQASSRSFEVR